MASNKPKMMNLSDIAEPDAPQVVRRDGGGGATPLERLASDEGVFVGAKNEEVGKQEEEVSQSATAAAYSSGMSQRGQNGTFVAKEEPSMVTFENCLVVGDRHPRTTNSLVGPTNSNTTTTASTTTSSVFYMKPNDGSRSASVSLQEMQVAGAGGAGSVSRELDFLAATQQQQESTPSAGANNNNNSCSGDGGVMYTSTPTSTSANDDDVPLVTRRNVAQRPPTEEITQASLNAKPMSNATITSQTHLLQRQLDHGLAEINKNPHKWEGYYEAGTAGFKLRRYEDSVQSLRVCYEMVAVEAGCLLGSGEEEASRRAALGTISTEVGSMLQTAKEKVAHRRALRVSSGGPTTSNARRVVGLAPTVPDEHKENRQLQQQQVADDIDAILDGWTGAATGDVGVAPPQLQTSTESRRESRLASYYASSSSPSSKRHPVESRRAPVATPPSPLPRRVAVERERGANTASSLTPSARHATMDVEPSPPPHHRRTTAGNSTTPSASPSRTQRALTPMAIVFLLVGWTQFLAKELFRVLVRENEPLHKGIEFVQRRVRVPIWVLVVIVTVVCVITAVVVSTLVVDRMSRDQQQLVAAAVEATTAGLKKELRDVGNRFQQQQQQHTSFQPAHAATPSTRSDGEGSTTTTMSIWDILATISSAFLPPVSTVGQQPYPLV